MLDPKTLFANAYHGRRVLVTGHTGFKGSWLALWLKHLGADVAGFSIGVPTSPSNFDLVRLEQRMHHYIGDIRDRMDIAQKSTLFNPNGPIENGDFLPMLIELAMVSPRQ